MMCKGGCSKNKLSAFALGSAVGITKGLALMLFAWAGAFLTIGHPLIRHLEPFYHGYAPTFMGGLIGGLTGLIIGFIAGFLIAIFYNLFLCCCRRRKEDEYIIKK